MKMYYLPVKEIEKLIWLQNFANKLDGYAAKYNIADTSVTDTQNGYTWLAFWMNYRNQYQEYVKKLSTYKNEIMSGSGAASLPPTPPVLGAIPTSVAPGVFTRTVSIVNIIKASLDYTEGDGDDLGIEGVDANERLNLQDSKPEISLRLINGGHPEIVWTKGMFEAVDIYVDRGNGVWVFLATDTVPNYTDTATLPTNGQTFLWKYKAIYRLDDGPVGQYSNPVSISVAGV